MLNRAQRRFYEELAQKKRTAILRWQKEDSTCEGPSADKNLPMFRRGTNTRRWELQQRLAYLSLKEYFYTSESREYRDLRGVEQAWLNRSYAITW